MRSVLRVLVAARVLATALLAAAAGAFAQVPSPHAIDIPAWFTESFLDFKEDVAEAARENKRVMVYFGQDGCPYCKALMQANFGNTPAGREIGSKARRHFVAIALNIWGDREVTWIDGRRGTEKTIARDLGVQFTPTLVFLDDDGRLALRLNGYLPPERFTHVLDYVIGRHDRRMSLAEYMDGAFKEPPRAGPPAPRPYLMRDPTRLSRSSRAGAPARPLVVLFESDNCVACDELHGDAFRRPALQTALAGFDVARLVPGRPRRLVAPDGRTSDTRTWARDLRVNLYPTAVFFDGEGREAFRFEGYLRPFHVESAFDYVASGAWRSEPQFQRFVQARADRLRAAGQPVDLWR